MRVQSQRPEGRYGGLCTLEKLDDTPEQDGPESQLRGWGAAVAEAKDQAAQRAESHILTPGGRPSGASPLGRLFPVCSDGRPSSLTPCHTGGGPLQRLTSTHHTCHNPPSK